MLPTAVGTAGEEEVTTPIVADITYITYIIPTNIWPN